MQAVFLYDGDVTGSLNLLASWRRDETGEPSFELRYIPCHGVNGSDDSELSNVGLE